MGSSLRCCNDHPGQSLRIERAEENGRIYLTHHMWCPRCHDKWKRRIRAWREEREDRPQGGHDAPLGRGEGA